MVCETLAKISLDYILETGKLFWRNRPWHPPNTNAKYRGKEAGTFILNGDIVYVRIGFGARHYYAHQLIWLMHFGYIPEDARIAYLAGRQQYFGEYAG